MVVFKFRYILSLFLLFAFVSPQAAVKSVCKIGCEAEILFPDDGDFMPDSVNVFKIAKDVSDLFMDAVNGDVYNDVNGDTKKLDHIFLANYASNDIGQAYSNAIEKEMRAKKGDLGINLKGDYTENFTPGISVDEDLTFKRRFYVGLEWDIIKGGLFDAGNQIHQMKMESILKEYEALEYVEQENYRYLFNYVNYLFNEKKIEVLKERKQLVSKQLQFTKDLYHLRYVGWEKVLQYQAKLEDIEHQIYQFQKFNDYIPSNIPDTLMSSGLTADQLPLFDVDLDSLIRIYYEHHSEDTVTQIKLAIYKDNMKWWKDITLKPFVRYNMYMDEFNIFKNYGSAGITLRVPLRFHNKGKLVKAQELIYEAEQLKELQAGDNELVNIYSEFGFKLKQIKDFYYRKMLNDELIRKELVKKDYRDVSFNPVFTLGLIDDKKAIESEIIDLKKRMYINLVRLAFYLEDKQPTNFINVLKPEDFSSRYNGSVKMFVTKEDLASHHSKDIANYLWKNEFIDVLVESSLETVSNDLSEMMEKTKFGNVFYSIMKKVPVNGNYPDVQTDINQLLSLEQDQIIGLHYELELLSSNDEINELNEVDISNWLSEISANAERGIRLSIGIPDGLGINVLNNIFQKFDLVFVHESGIPNRVRLETDYASELTLDNDKLVVTLSAKDFADRMHLENYMSNIHETLNVQNFGFSNYSSMTDVDIKTFEKGSDINLQPGQLVASVREQIYKEEENKDIEETTTEENNSSQDEEPTQGVITEEEGQEELVVEQDQPEEETPQEEIVTETDDTEGEMIVVTEDNSEGIYRIQVAASKVSLSQQYLKKFKSEVEIREVIIDELYKYTIGNYSSESDAEYYLKVYKAKSGNNGAFIVTY